ncbi:hypothetical protein CAMSH0001_1562 [Campylobacter showae RM3277]|uniref:Uncharacterized protein n=1 Tax=Campylobacter showae RM3277 TaxID=553219 RepID=C6RCX6_9BACT|nr:hypothetical protein CAMSH0001_1562 [Campylobacter showae RM3277]
MRERGLNLKFIGEAANLQKQAGQKLLEFKFGLGKFEITNLEIYKNPPVKFNGRGKFKGA